MKEQELWDEVLGILNDSKKQIHIYKGTETVGKAEIDSIGVSINSVLGAIILYTAGICIDNWIRVIGQNCAEHNGIFQYNSDQINKKHNVMEGMLIVAQDIVGGIFAINVTRFNEYRKKVWYFAPDTLEWECLNINYAEFIAWAACGNTDEFYSGMRWETWVADCKNISFDKAFLIYPFLWSAECDLSAATKKVVPFIELKEMNMDYAERF